MLVSSDPKDRIREYHDKVNQKRRNIHIKQKAKDKIFKAE
jgi:hypothetical protein